MRRQTLAILAATARARAGLLLVGLVAALALGPVGGTTWAGASSAGNLKAVIELFTSQGCSSCPAADALLKRYVDRDDVIALTLPVDYWDYLGWKDTFASPQFSARQRAYARARGDGQVYTPQVVVNGLAHAVGSRQWEIERAIAETNRRLAAGRVPIALRLEGDVLIIEAGEANEYTPVRSATVWLALVRKSDEVAIKRGENGGRRLRYYNIVRKLRKIGSWNGRAKTIRVSGIHAMAKGIDGCTVLLQRGNDGPIIGAAELENW